MVRGKGRTGRKVVRQVLTPSEIQTLKADRNEAAAMLKEAEGYGDGGPGSQMDKARVQAEVRKLDKAIEDGSPRKMRGGDKDKINDRAKELASSIQEGMPTRDEMRNLRDNPGAPFKNLEWQKRNAQKIQEYKQIMRRLEPGDPMASNIENLRFKN